MQALLPPSSPSPLVNHDTSIVSASNLTTAQWIVTRDIPRIDDDLTMLQANQKVLEDGLERMRAVVENNSNTDIKIQEHERRQVEMRAELSSTNLECTRLQDTIRELLDKNENTEAELTALKAEFGHMTSEAQSHLNALITTNADAIASQSLLCAKRHDTTSQAADEIRDDVQLLYNLHAAAQAALEDSKEDLNKMASTEAMRCLDQRLSLVEKNFSALYAASRPVENLEEHLALMSLDESPQQEEESQTGQLRRCLDSHSKFFKQVKELRLHGRELMQRVTALEKLGAASKQHATLTTQALDKMRVRLQDSEQKQRQFFLDLDTTWKQHASNVEVTLQHGLSKLHKNNDVRDLAQNNWFEQQQKLWTQWRQTADSLFTDHVKDVESVVGRHILEQEERMSAYHRTQEGRLAEQQRTMTSWQRNAELSITALVSKNEFTFANQAQGIVNAKLERQLTAQDAANAKFDSHAATQTTINQRQHTTLATLEKRIALQQEAFQRQELANETFQRHISAQQASGDKWAGMNFTHQQHKRRYSGVRDRMSSSPPPLAQSSPVRGLSNSRSPSYRRPSISPFRPAQSPSSARTHHPANNVIDNFGAPDNSSSDDDSHYELHNPAQDHWSHRRRNSVMSRRGTSVAGSKTARTPLSSTGKNHHHSPTPPKRRKLLNGMWRQCELVYQGGMCSAVSWMEGGSRARGLRRGSSGGDDGGVAIIKPWWCAEHCAGWGRDVRRGT